MIKRFASATIASFILLLISGCGGGGGGVAPTTYPLISLSTSASSIAENSSSSITLTATSTKTSDENITVTLATSGTATDGTDYSSTNGETITITAGQTTGTKTISMSDDSTYEGSETIIASISSVSGGSARENGTQSETITITDNESAPSITLNASTTSLAENSGTTITITATSSQASDEDVTVTLSTSGTATDGTDYSSTTGETITISAGSTTGTKDITLTDDSTYEGNETIIVSVSSVSGSSATDGSSAQTITITENESAPSITISASTSSLAEDSGTTITITATTSVVADEDITVTLGTSGTATDGTDYSSTDGQTITISAGSTSGTKSITITDDSDGESNETIIVSVDSVSGASARDGSSAQTITIIDNEVPQITLSVDTSTVAENATSTSLVITATASKVASENITVNLSYAGTAVDSDDYQNFGSSITIAAGSLTGTTSGNTVDDSRYEGASETIIVSISSVSGGSAVNASSAQTITITENESAPQVYINSRTDTFAESKASASLYNVCVFTTEYADTDMIATLSIGGTATNGTDYPTISSTITISDGSGSGCISPDFGSNNLLDSTYDGGNETITISVASVSGGPGATVKSDSGTITTTITDNDSAPTVALSVNSNSASEGGSDTTFTATLSGKTDEDVTVELAANNTSGILTMTQDWAYSDDENITISSGSLTGTLAVEWPDDTTYETTDTVVFSVNSVSGGGATESGTQSETITVSDDDSAPSLTLSLATSSADEDDSTTYYLTYTLSNPTYQDVSMLIQSEGSPSSTYGTDWDVTGDLSVATVISAGDTIATEGFAIIDDSIYEGNETIIIGMQSLSGGGATEAVDQQVTFTITENESAPTITLTNSDTSYAEEAADGPTLTLTSSVAADEDIDITFSTSGTATDGIDYDYNSTRISDLTVTITAGQTTATQEWGPIGDMSPLYEGDETVIIAIDSVSGADATESGNQSITMTIVEEQSAPVITLSTSDTTTVAENASSSDDIVLTATSSVAADEDITVTLSTSGTATDGTDYSIDGGANVDGQTITISSGSTTGNLTALGPIGDTTALYEGDETAVVAISSVSGADASESSTPQSVTITITEEQSAPTITLTSSASSVYDDGSNLTLTATSSVAADEDITVTLATSGTATEGSDYASLSDITISSGVTTGTAAFNPTSETVNEGAETATIAIDTVTGADASESGTQSITITINEYALGTGTQFTEGTAAEQLTIKSAANWTNLEGSSSTGSVHPYELMNIHKVHSFSDGTNNLTGVGQVIHIADFNCDDSHDIYNNKTIYNLDDGDAGESTFGAANSSNYHCQFVSNMAAGDSSADVIGVAPDADLVLSSIPNYAGTFSSDDYAADLDAARGYGAVASNNSWGLADSTDGNPNANFNKTEAQAFYDANIGTYSKDEIFGYVHEGVYSSSGAGMDAQTAAWQSYIQALDDFQDSGVIVFANGNYSEESDASFYAALPEFYSQLGEAWLSVNLADFSGSSLDSATTSDFTLLGNKCGSAKEYCVTVDDTLLKGGTYVSGGVSQYGDDGSGSSYGAPMVAGGIALMSQAFPNHTPEQLTDRVLASANNGWFTAEGSTTFTSSNGVTISHGYHSDWGHGVPDFYAALSPITSSSNPASMAIYTGQSQQSSQRQALGSSILKPSSSFGDSILTALSSETIYAYDLLDGGFEINMNKMVDMTNNNAKTISVSSELSKLDGESEHKSTSWRNDFSRIAAKPLETDKLQTAVTVGSSSLPVQSFFGTNIDPVLSLNDFETPYLEANEGGIGANATYQFDGARLLVGMTNPLQTNSDGQTVGTRKSLIASVEVGEPEFAGLTLMTGITEEKDNLLGSTGSSALSFDESKSNTVFTALKAQTKISNDITITGIGTLATTDMSRPKDSLIESANNVKSTSLSLIANKKELTGDDNLSVFVTQPNRVIDGTMSVRIGDLAQSDGSITYTTKDLSLKPSAKQLDYGIYYQKSLDTDVSFAVKHMFTDNLNHQASSERVSSSFIGIKYQDFKVGVADNSGDEGTSAELSYKMKF